MGWGCRVRADARRVRRCSEAARAVGSAAQSDGPADPLVLVWREFVGKGRRGAPMVVDREPLAHGAGRALKAYGPRPERGALRAVGDEGRGRLLRVGEAVPARCRSCQRTDPRSYRGACSLIVSPGKIVVSIIRIRRRSPRDAGDASCSGPGWGPRAR